MLYESSKLRYLDLSNFNTSIVNNMNSMFFKCYSLKLLDISSFNMEKDSNYEDKFLKVMNLKYLNIYDVVNTNNILQENFIN